MSYPAFGSWGDEMLAAGEAKLLAARHPSGRCAIVDAGGKARWHPAWEGLPFLVRPEQYAAGTCATLVNYRGHRPYCVEPLTFEAGYQWTGWRARDHWPQFSLSAEERALGEGQRRAYGPYVVIEPHNNPRQMPNRHWGKDRYQALVELLRLQGITIIQVGPDPALTLRGVHFRKTVDFRMAMGVLSGSVAYIGNQGGLHHGAAALHVPAVILFGGTEPPELMGYPTNVNLASRLPGSPCGQIKPCGHCVRAMAEITPQMVSSALTLLLHRRPFTVEPTEAA